MKFELPLNINPVTLVSRLGVAARSSGLDLCHWKSNVRFDLSVRGGTDLDLLIPADQRDALTRILIGLGFVEFASPVWSRYEGVTDWLGVDAESGRLLHLHLHTRLLTGMKGVKEQDLPWSDVLFANARIERESSILLPTPEIEYLVYVAREAVKSRTFRGRLTFGSRSPFSAADAIAELNWLWGSVSHARLDLCGRLMFGGQAWERIVKSGVDPTSLSVSRVFAKTAKHITVYLSPWRTRSSRASAFVFLMQRFKMYMAKLHMRFGGLPIGKRIRNSRGAIVAFVGSDGSGKSTTTAALVSAFGKKLAIQKLYLGSNVGLYKRARQFARLFRLKTATPTTLENHKSPSTGFVETVEQLISLRARIKNVKKAGRLSRKGVLTIADRWPQSQIPDLCDGVFSTSVSSSPWIARLIEHYQGILIKELDRNKPDLIIKLNIDPDTAIQRKNDHSPMTIRRKIMVVNQLNYHGSAIRNIDASRPLSEVVGMASSYVWDAMADMNDRDGAH